MLVEDRTAFIERLEVLADGKHRSRHRRRVAHAELEVLKLRRDVQAAAGALRELEQRQARSGAPATADRRRLGWRHPRPLARELDAVRKHLQASRDELARSQERLDRLQREAREQEMRRREPLTFRLHSAEHHLDCSERRFARLSDIQLTQPVLVTKRHGRRWWWYQNRFWWDDEGLVAHEVQSRVLRSDLESKLRSDALRQARVAVLGIAEAQGGGEPAPETVQPSVWFRDLGRCVDCGSKDGVVFDRVDATTTDVSHAGGIVELRCQPCRDRREHNERRARVSKARIEAVPLGPSAP